MSYPAAGAPRPPPGGASRTARRSQCRTWPRSRIRRRCEAPRRDDGPGFRGAGARNDRSRGPGAESRGYESTNFSGQPTSASRLEALCFDRMRRPAPTRFGSRRHSTCGFGSASAPASATTGDRASPSAAHRPATRSRASTVIRASTVSSAPSRAAISWRIGCVSIGAPSDHRGIASTRRFLVARIT